MSEIVSYINKLYKRGQSSATELCESIKLGMHYINYVCSQGSVNVFVILVDNTIKIESMMYIQYIVNA